MACKGWSRTSGESNPGPAGSKNACANHKTTSKYSSASNQTWQFLHIDHANPHRGLCVEILLFLHMDHADLRKGSHGNVKTPQCVAQQSNKLHPSVCLMPSLKAVFSPGFEPLQVTLSCWLGLDWDLKPWFLKRAHQREGEER